MIIDWYTVIFQIANFLILVFLLRYFLYGPIIRAMDEREQKIAERERLAESSVKSAEAEAEDYRNRSEELRKNEERTMEKAREKADEEKSRLLNAARIEVEDARKRWEEAFESEKESFTVELRKRIGNQVCTVARRCLVDLADADLEEMVRNRFNHKLKELPEGEQQKLITALGKTGFKATVAAAFEFPSQALHEMKAIMGKMLRESGGHDKLEITAKKDAALVCGLELAAGGHRVAWNIDHYLAGVEEQILDGLEHEGNSAEKRKGPAGDKS